MKILNALAAISIIVYVGYFFIGEIRVAMAVKEIEQTVRGETLRQELRELGLYD